jgi:transcriptional regulator with XRE-family HTH domain
MPNRTPAKKDPKNEPQAKAVERAAVTRRIVAQNVVALAEAKKLTQRDLAEKTGLSVAYVSMIYRGLREPTLTTLHALAQALGLGAKAHRLLSRPQKDVPAEGEQAPAAQ